MRSLLAAALAALAFPALGHAAGASLSVRDLPVRQSGIAQVPRTFDLVGIHWQGPGRVLFRTRSTAGHWSSWEGAAPEEDGPDSLNVEGMEASPWRIGDPFWAGEADAIQYRQVGAVKRVRAYFVSSPAVRIPPRTLSIAGSPPIITRAAWGADESIRRKAPSYAATVRFAIVHHTAGTNSYGPAQSAAIVRGIERYHVLGNGWDDIGYNFLVDRYGQVFEGRYGGVDQNVIGAHAQGFNDGSTGVAVLGTYGSSGIPAAARTALAKLLAWRLDVAHVDPLSTLTVLSGGNPRFPTGAPVFLRAIAGHRDTGFTSCPGNALYAQLPTIARDAAATGLPKVYAPSAQGQIGQPIRITADLSNDLPWTVTITDAAGNTIASGAGSGTAVDWTWDATRAPPGRYSYTIAAPDVRPAIGHAGQWLPKLKLASVTTTPATLQRGSATIRYRLTAAATVTATLRDSAGKQLATLFTGARRAGRQSFSFAADRLAEGRYRIVLAAATVDGQQAAATAVLRVDRTVTDFAADTPVLARSASTVTFTFSVNSRPARVTLRIQRGSSTVATLANAEYQPGPQGVAWDGRGPSGRRVRPGPYAAVLRATSSIATVTLITPLRVR
jgi:hypothetical protein